jgi:hypothetical protein
VSVFCPEGYVPAPEAIGRAAEYWFPERFAALERAAARNPERLPCGIAAAQGAGGDPLGGLPVPLHEGGWDLPAEAGEFDESPDPASRALLDQMLKLPADAKKELDLQLQTVIPRKKPSPVKLTMLSEPAATQSSPFAPGKVVFHRGVVRGGVKSTTPAHRQKKMEFIKNYLAVHRIKGNKRP